MIYDLQTIIRQKIAQEGKVGFADFMQLALYHPEFGYYCQKEMKIGKDFTTAPEISPLFAACLLPLINQVFDVIGTNNILELGAGSGILARNILSSGLNANYYICELSPSLRAQQKALLEGYNVHWLDELPQDFAGVILANEVLDALPVSLVQVDNQTIKERCINLEDGKFKWELEPCDLKLPFKVPDGYQTEVHTETPQFLQKIVNCFDKGLILFIDYGYGVEEYYHPERNQGTLTCFHQHQKNNDPLLHAGQQDITAHVNFTQVAEFCFNQGYEVAGYTNQAAFLLDAGLMDMAAEQIKDLNPVDQFKLNQSIKVLTMPTEMGEVIKVMALTKMIEINPKGFGLLDRRRDL